MQTSLATNITNQPRNADSDNKKENEPARWTAVAGFYPAASSSWSLTRRTDASVTKSGERKQMLEEIKRKDQTHFAKLRMSYPFAHSAKQQQYIWNENNILTWLIRASRIFSTLPLLMMFVMNTLVSLVELIIVSKNELLITVLLMLVLLMKVEFTVIAAEASLAFRAEISSVISPMRPDISWINLESP